MKKKTGNIKQFSMIFSFIFILHTMQHISMNFDTRFLRFWDLPHVPHKTRFHKVGQGQVLVVQLTLFYQGTHRDGVGAP